MSLKDNTSVLIRPMCFHELVLLKPDSQDIDNKHNVIVVFRLPCKNKI